MKKRCVKKSFSRSKIDFLSCRKKAAFEMDQLAWWIIGVAVLVVVLFGLVILKGKGVGAMQYLNNIFRFGK